MLTRRSLRTRSLFIATVAIKGLDVVHVNAFMSKQRDDLIVKRIVDTGRSSSKINSKSDGSGSRK